MIALSSIGCSICLATCSNNNGLPDSVEPIETIEPVEPEETGESAETREIRKPRDVVYRKLNVASNLIDTCHCPEDVDKNPACVQLCLQAYPEDTKKYQAEQKAKAQPACACDKDTSAQNAEARKKPEKTMVKRDENSGKRYKYITVAIPIDEETVDATDAASAVEPLSKEKISDSIEQEFDLEKLVPELKESSTEVKEASEDLVKLSSESQEPKNISIKDKKAQSKTDKKRSKREAKGKYTKRSSKGQLPEKKSKGKGKK